MTNAKSTKRALLTSVVSLILCFTMLLGTTFAWFTDSVTSANNVIQSGNLDIELDYWDGDSWETIEGTNSLFTNNLWEPGHTEVVYLKLSNLGSLALKYQLAISVLSETEGTNMAGDPFKLSDYIQMGVVEGVNGETNAYADREAAVDAVKDASGIIGAGYAKQGNMLEGDPKLYMAVVVYMPETVDNVANAMTGTDAPIINLGVKVLATQYTAEVDSFDDQYDVDSIFVAEVKNANELALALKAGGNVKLMDNVALADGEVLVIPEGVVASLDLNGKTINGGYQTGSTTKHVYAIENRGTLTLKNGTVNARGVGNYGALKIESGTYNAIDTNGGGSVWNYEGSELIINGGTFTAADVATSPAACTLNVAKNSTAVINGGIFNGNADLTYAVISYGELTVNGGSFVGEHGAIAIQNGGSLIVNDGSYEVTGTSTDHVIYAPYGNATINGGSYNLSQADASSFGSTIIDGTVVINGGTFDSVSGAFAYAGADITLNGGTYMNKASTVYSNADGISEFVADGYKVTESNGKYVVSVDLNNVCSANAFEDALAEGGNVNVTANIEVDDVVMIPEGKEVVLNLNGNTLSKSVDSGIVVRNYGKLTLTGNGTIDGTIGNYAIRTEAGSELTIGDGIVVDGGFGAVSCFGGKLTINGGDFSNEESNTTHYVVYATNNSTVVINGGTFTFADDQYAGANGSPILAATNGTTIEINGGTFDATGGSSLCYNANNIVIKGGTFKNKATATYGGNIEGKVADGYAVTKNGNVWTVAAN